VSEAEALNARLAELFEAHAGRLLAFARTMTDAAGADDAVQETFLRVLLYGRKSAREIDLPYLLVTVRNVIRRERRRAGPGAWDHAAPGVAAGGRACFAGAADPEAHERSIARHVEALREPLREALVLTAVQGLSGARAARALGVPTHAVERRRRLAVRTLRRSAEAWLESRGRRVGVG